VKREMKITFILMAAAAGMCLVPASTVHASSDFVTLDFTGDSPARLGYATIGYRTFLTQVGQAVFDVHDEAGSYAGLGKDIVDASPDDRTTGYCIDVYQAITAGRTYRFDVVDLVDAPTLGNNSLVAERRAKDLERLFAKYADDVVGADTAAAFAAAVWEIVNETNLNTAGNPVYDVRGGAFKVTPASGGSWDRQANRWLCDLDTTIPDNQSAYALVNCRVQDFAWVMCVPTTGKAPPPVPEPITFLSGLLAVSGLGFYMRKRAKVTT